jgi:hypothetical protein
MVNKYEKVAQNLQDKSTQATKDIIIIGEH